MQYTNRQQFRLKIDLGDADRQKLREVQLYVKNGSEAWSCRETAPPTQTHFSFKAPQDGEYWFTIVTVDKAGKATPTDVTKEAPAFVVVVDTVAPEVNVAVPAPAARAKGDEMIHCTVKDASADPAGLKMEYQTLDKSWRPLDSVGGPDTFRCPDKNAWTGQLRVTATDLAKNTAVKEFNAGTAPTASAGPAPLPTPPVTTNVAEKPATAAGPDLGSPERTQAAGSPVGRDPGMALMPPAPMGTAPTALPPPPAAAASREPAPAARDNGPANRQLVNQLHAVLDYRIDQIGPSGVGRVEVWLTADEGKTWQRLCEDPDRRSPVEFDLPREGTFGVSVVVTNGNGQGDPPPVPGTAPDLWIEVDTTKPTAALAEVRPSLEDPYSVVIKWSASDKNLTGEPIDLYYAVQPQGPWTPVARGVKNDGSYVWHAPRDAGPQFFVRLEATDRAGNVCRCDATQAVVLDPSKPKAKPLGVTASAPRPATPPTGN